MTTLDTPVQELEVNLDTPVSETQPLSSSTERLETFKAIKSAYLDHYNTGKPLIQAYQESKAAFDKDGELSQLSQDKLEVDKESAIQSYEQILQEDPELFTEAVEAEALDLGPAREEMAKDPTAQFVDSISGIDTDDTTKSAVANYVKLYEMLEAATGDISTGDFLLDFGSSLIPLVSTGREASTLGQVFNNEDLLRDVIFNFKSQPFEEQQAQFPQLIEELVGGLGPIRGIDALTKFIDPNTGDELGDFSNWWKVIDAVDIASLGSAAAFKISKFKQAFNLPKVLDQAENPEAAGDVVAASLASEEIADAANITQESAFGDAIAFDTSTIDPAYTGGISDEVIRSRDEFFGVADRTVEDIMRGNGYLREGILNSVERATKESLIAEQFSKARHENIRVTGRTENTTTFSYQAKDDEGNLFDETYTLDLTLDDVGQWNQSEVGVLSSFLASPTVFAKGDTLLDVKAAERLDSQTAKAFRQLTDLQNAATAPLGNLLRPKNRKRLAEIEQALKDGDEFANDNGSRGTVFDVDTLRGTYNLDPQQIETYYRTNRLYNNLWRLRNNTKREEMIALKFKQVNLLDEEYSFGKPHVSEGDAVQAVNRSSSNLGFDVQTDEVVELTKEYIEEQYALGKVLVKLPESYNAGGGRGKFTNVFVEGDSINELPSVVLNRKKGYVPRISQNGDWFVKEFGEDIVDGQSVESVIKTHRYFDNKKDAETFREQLITTAMKSKEEGGEGLTRIQAEKKFRNLEDREQEIISTATGQFSHGSGGIYTGARAQDEILFGLSGDSGLRVGPYEALVRNIANISRMVPINQWRLGLEQRWINTARALTGEDISKFGELPSTIESTRSGEFLNTMAKQIRDWQGFPSKEEQVFNSITQRLHEWALNGNREKIAKVTGWMRDKDPVAASRAAAFHALLGWFNPAQLWVQAQGMSVAVSINMGKNLTKTLKQTSAMAFLGSAPNPSPARIKLAAKAHGMTAEELENLHTLWTKTGLEDSILQTADHAAAIRGHGIAMQAISNTANKHGLMFYRPGELLTRRMAFTTALDEWQTTTGKLTPTNDELKTVLDRTNNLMLNLGKANRASFQKGIASIPTQFLQVSTKSIESLVGANTNFTRAERGRILAGQIALYGAAGVPLAGLGINYMKEFLGVTQEEIDNNPLLVKAINDGFWGFTTLGIFGVDAEVASRGSLIRGVTDFVDNWVYSESTIGDKLLGAFGSVNNRFWDTLVDDLRPIMFSPHQMDAIDIAKLPLMPFLESVSTWRNAEKAVFMQQIDAILDQNGNPTVGREFEIKESIMAAIGFQLSDEAKIYDLNDMSQNVLDANKRVVDMLIDRMNEDIWRKEAGLFSEERAKETSQFYAVVYGSLGYDRQQDVREAVRRRVEGDSKLAKAIRKYRDKVIGNTATALNDMKAAVLGTNLQTLNNAEEEE